MAQADGHVLIDTKINTDGMEKGFDKLVRGVDKIATHVEKIGNLLEHNFSGKAVDSLGDAASAAQNAGQQITESFSNVRQSGDILNVVASAAENAGNHIRAAFSDVDGAAPINKTLENARYRVAQLEQQYANIVNELKTADINDKSTDRLAMQKAMVYDRLAEARRRLALEVAAAAQKEAAAEEKAAAREVKAAERKAKAEERAAKKRLRDATKGLRRLSTRMSEIAMGSIIYNTIGQAVLAMTQYFGAALKSNDQFTASFARLKAALLTAFQPIYEAVVPALITMMNVLTAVINTVGRFFAAISGKDYSQIKQNAEALYEQAEGIDAVGSAAKKAKKALAGFDEINRLSFTDTSAGGAGAAGTVVPDFSEPEPVENLDEILRFVKQVGLALATWKISGLFLDDMGKAAGLGFAVGSAFGLATDFIDAFNNGIDWNNLGGMIANIIGLTIGLGIAFGAPIAAIGLLVGAFALLIPAVKEWIETGELSNEGCAAIVLAITAIGGVIALLTGSWIPLAIGAVAGFAFACAMKGDEIKGVLAKLDEWLQGVFATDWREVFGPVLGGILNGFFNVAKSFWDSIKLIFDGFIDFIAGVFTGDWDRALNGLISILQGIFDGVLAVLTAPFRLFKDWIYDLARKFFPDAWKEGINSAITSVNKFISWLNDKLTFKIPPIEIAGQTIFKGGSIRLVKIPQIPYLAKGAVIPANNPFLAVLGDQKHGTNIEAPLSTIEEAVERVMARRGGVSDERIVSLLSQILEAVLGIEIDGETLTNAMESYQRKRAVSLGG